MRSKFTNPKVINLIIILVVSLGVSSVIYYSPQSSMMFPITPFMSYYTKIGYTQDTGKAASEAYTGITIVWLSKIINTTTIEISEMDIETEFGFIPKKFNETKSYSVNILTRKVNNSNEKFLFWALPYWNLVDIPTETLLPIEVEDFTSFVTGEENRMVLQLVRDTKVAWYWNKADLSVAHYDKHSGFLIEYKARIGNSIEIYQLQSIIGLNLGIAYNYYGLMIFLFAIIPALIVYFLTLGIRRKKVKKGKIKPLERAEQDRFQQPIETSKEIKEAI
ncbi:MAG: hypothetical protein ACFFCM_15175 [Promethearchaeota archaeon]